MNTQQAKDRFNELVFTINLLSDEPPTDPTEDRSWTFPRLSEGLADPRVFQAVICQALKGDTDFRLKMASVLTASAVSHMADTEEHKPTEDDIYALATSANILWAIGAVEGTIMTMGMIIKACMHFDLEVPDMISQLLRPNGNVDKFGKLNPYDIIDGKVANQDIIDLANKTE